MKIEFSEDELALIKLLLTEEESQTNIEIHHSRNLNYKELLLNRKSEIHKILEKIMDTAAPTTV